MEGVVLKTQEYREKQLIVTLFTEEGLTTLFMGRKSGVTPPTLADFAVREGKTGLLSCAEVKILRSYISLRKSLAHLRATGAILQSLLQTQMPGKPSPDLFLLLKTYLDKLPESENPATLALSFELKLHNHEGTLALNPRLFSTEEWDQLHTLTYARTFAPITQLGQVDATLAKRALSSA